jgi:hypothetical protein
MVLSRTATMPSAGPVRRVSIGLAFQGSTGASEVRADDFPRPGGLKGRCPAACYDITQDA